MDNVKDGLVIRPNQMHGQMYMLLVGLSSYNLNKFKQEKRTKMEDHTYQKRQ